MSISACTVHTINQKNKIPPFFTSLAVMSLSRVIINDSETSCPQNSKGPILDRLQQPRISQRGKIIWSMVLGGHATNRTSYAIKRLFPFPSPCFCNKAEMKESCPITRIYSTPPITNLSNNRALLPEISQYFKSRAGP